MARSSRSNVCQGFVLKELNKLRSPKLTCPFKSNVFLESKQHKKITEKYADNDKIIKI